MLVGETGFLYLAQQLCFQAIEASRTAGGESVAKFKNSVEPLQKPVVNLRQLMDLLQRVAGLKSAVDGKDALLIGLAQKLVDGGVIQVLLGPVGHEAALAGVEHPQALLNGFLEGFTDGHHLAHALHGRTNLAVHARELAQVPARQLHHHVVQGGLEKGRRRLRHAVFQLGQRVAQAQLGGHEGQRVARGLGGQRRGARQSRVHLNHAVILRHRVEGVLNVALAHDAQVANGLDADSAQLVVLAVAQRL